MLRGTAAAPNPPHSYRGDSPQRHRGHGGKGENTMRTKDTTRASALLPTPSWPALRRLVPAIHVVELTSARSSYAGLYHSPRIARCRDVDGRTRPSMTI